MNRNWISPLALAAALLPACVLGDTAGDEEDVSTASEALVEDFDFTTETPNGTCTHAISFEREMIMVDTWIVDDARAKGMGPWSFGNLMTGLAGGNPAPAFVRDWLGTWEHDVKMTPPGGKTETVPGNARNVHDVLIDPWPRVGGHLDLSKAPFRLLAIVYRPDLEDLADHSGGELRFVYGAKGGGGRPVPMTVAFEYRIPAASHAQAVAFAKGWYGKLAPLHHAGTDAAKAGFLDALASLTKPITAAGADPASPNGSALAQLRTNEVAIDTPWDLREFRLSAPGDALELSFAPGVPLMSLNGTKELGGYVLGNGVPASKETAMARMPAEEWFWRPMPNVGNQKRHDFAMTTCNGCHSAETGTTFLHVFPREAGERARLSKFLSKRNAQIEDPVSGVVRVFDEPGRRMQILNDLLCE